MVLRRIFVHRRDEVTGEWRRLHNEELNDLYCSPNIVRMIKWRRMIWARHVARMGEEMGCLGSLWGNLRERDHLGDLGVDGWIILGRISKRWDVGIWTGLGTLTSWNPLVLSRSLMLYPLPREGHNSGLSFILSF
jgi:hypothetical protein